MSTTNLEQQIADMQAQLANLLALAQQENNTPPINGKANSKPESTSGVEIFATVKGKDRVSLGTIRRFRKNGGLLWTDKILMCANMVLSGHDLRQFDRQAITASGKRVGTWRVALTGKGCTDNNVDPYNNPQDAIAKVKALDFYNPRESVLLPENGNVANDKPAAKVEKVTVSVNVPPAPGKANVPHVPEEKLAISINDWRKNVYAHLVDETWINSGQGWTAENMHSEAVSAQAKLAQAGVKVQGKVTQVPYSTLISLAIANDLL